MPKLKTKNAAKKRFQLTATGLVKYKKPGMRHLQESKRSKRKRQLRRSGLLSRDFAKSMTVLIGG